MKKLTREQLLQTLEAHAYVNRKVNRPLFLACNAVIRHLETEVSRAYYTQAAISRLIHTQVAPVFTLITQAELDAFAQYLINEVNRVGKS